MWFNVECFDDTSAMIEEPVMEVTTKVKKTRKKKKKKKDKTRPTEEAIIDEAMPIELETEVASVEEIQKRKKKKDKTRPTEVAIIDEAMPIELETEVASVEEIQKRKKKKDKTRPTEEAIIDEAMPKEPVMEVTTKVKKTRKKKKKKDKTRPTEEAIIDEAMPIELETEVASVEEIQKRKKKKDKTRPTEVAIIDEATPIELETEVASVEETQKRKKKKDKTRPTEEAIIDEAMPKEPVMEVTTKVKKTRKKKKKKDKTRPTEEAIIDEAMPIELETEVASVEEIQKRKKKKDKTRPTEVAIIDEATPIELETEVASVEEIQKRKKKKDKTGPTEEAIIDEAMPKEPVMEVTTKVKKTRKKKKKKDKTRPTEEAIIDEAMPIELETEVASVAETPKRKKKKDKTRPTEVAIIDEAMPIELETEVASEAEMELDEWTEPWTMDEDAYMTYDGPDLQGGVVIEAVERRTRRDQLPLVAVRSPPIRAAMSKTESRHATPRRDSDEEWVPDNRDENNSPELFNDEDVLQEEQPPVRHTSSRGRVRRRGATTAGSRKAAPARDRNRTKVPCSLGQCRMDIFYNDLPRHIRSCHPQIASHAAAEAKRMREAFKRREEVACAKAKRSTSVRWRCPVGEGTPTACGAVVQVLSRHLATHFAKDSDEYRSAMQRRTKAEEMATPEIGLPFLLTKYTAYLTSVRGGLYDADKTRRHVKAVELLVPVILPEVPMTTVTPDKILAALSGEELACEADDGWLVQEVRCHRRTASSLKDEVRRFGRFVAFLDLTLESYGLEHERPRMTAVHTRLTNWKGALKTSRWERTRHQDRQRAAVVSMDWQQKFLESEYVKNLEEIPAEDEPAGYMPARDARNGLMLLSVVRCAGRPSHATGITVEDVKKAKSKIVGGIPMRLISNTEFKTADSQVCEVTVTEKQWERYLHHADVERAAICDTPTTDKLFISRAGTEIGSSNANKIFGAVWRQALGPEAPRYTARGGRFGAVMATALAEPDAQEDVAAVMAHDVRTARRYYDVHGVGDEQRRLKGNAVLMRLRGELRDSSSDNISDISDGNDGDTGDGNGGAIGDGNGGAIGDEHVTPAPAEPGTSKSAASAAADEHLNDDTSTTTPQRTPQRPAEHLSDDADESTHAKELRAKWTAAEVNILKRAAKEMIEGNNYKEKILYSKPGVKEGLKSKTTKQVYNRYKYLKKLYNARKQREAQAREAQARAALAAQAAQAALN